MARLAEKLNTDIMDSNKGGMLMIVSTTICMVQLEYGSDFAVKSLTQDATLNKRRHSLGKHPC